MCIYLHRQLADMLKGWGGWCRLAFKLSAGIQQAVCYPLVMSQASILLLGGGKRGEQGRNQDPLHCADLTPLQKLDLSTQGSASKLSLHNHAAPRAHPPVSGASVPSIQT